MSAEVDLDPASFPPCALHENAGVTLYDHPVGPYFGETEISGSRTGLVFEVGNDTLVVGRPDFARLDEYVGGSLRLAASSCY